MESPTVRNTPLLHQEYDRISVPEDVPELGIRAGEEGVIRRLTYLRDTVFAFVLMSFSTGQPKGWIVVEVKPERRVRSFTTIAR